MTRGAAVRPGSGLAVLLAAATLAWAPGCDRLREKEALRRFGRSAVAVERQGARVDALGSPLRVLVAAGDLAKIRRLLRERLLPAHQAWVRAARALPTEPPRIREIRGSYVKAVEASMAGYEGFAETLREDTLASRWEALRRLRQGLADARQRFRASVDRRLRSRDMVVRWKLWMPHDGATEKSRREGLNGMM